MADRGKRNLDELNEDMARSPADEQIRGVGDEIDEEFEDTEELDEEEEEEGTM
jgi:hypothetical protein